MKTQEMRTHVKIVGWLYIVMGLLGILLALVVGAIILAGGLISGDDTAIRVTTIVSIILGGLVILLSIPGVVAGIGLLNFKPWARILTIILSVLNLPGFPIGTAVGIYSLWVLLDSETSLLFEGSNPPVPSEG